MSCDHKMSKRSDLIEEEGEDFPLRLPWMRLMKRASPSDEDEIFLEVKRGKGEGKLRGFYTDWAKMKKGVPQWDDNLLRMI